MITEPSTKVPNDNRTKHKCQGCRKCYFFVTSARACVCVRERERELSTNFFNYLLHPFLLLVIQKSDSQTLVAAASQQ